MSLSPFYIGHGSNLGSVQAATARNFRELVDRYLNVAVQLNCTRAQYAGMNDEARKTAKRVNYLVPAVFRTSPSRRVTECAEHCNLLHIDLDKDPDGHYPASAFIHNPGALHNALHPWSFAAYITASSTAETPRMRILVHADKIPVKDYPQAVVTIFDLLGVRHVTTESKVAIQPMYLPSLFAGDDPVTQHPLIASHCTGQMFSVADIRDVKVQEFLPKSGALVGADALEFLRPQMREITLEIAQEALASLDPDISYPDWLEVAAALRHQFTPHHEEEAYTLFDRWSATGSKYVSAEDTLAKWKSLRPTPIGRMPVTIRTLIRKAANAGWSCHEVKEICFNTLRGWMQTGARTASALLAEGIGRIAATPLISKTEEAALLHELRAQAKMRFGINADKTALHRDLRNVRAEIAKRKSDDATTDTIPTWAKGLIYVARYGIVFRQSTGEELGPEEVNATFGRYLLPTEAQLREAGMAPTIANLSRPLVPPFQYLLNSIKIPTVHDFVYDPSRPDDLFTEEGGVTLINTYVRCHPLPDEATGIIAGNAVRRHLETIILEKDYVRIVLDYLAFLVQNPGQKVRWMILLQGAQGCGKSVIADIMRIVLGARHVKIVDCQTIHTQYNDWMDKAQFIVIEEIRVAGHNRHDVMNALKAVVTNDVIRINQKFKDSRETQNRANLMALTNYRDAIVVDENDRRHCVIQCLMQTKHQVLSMGTDYFEDLYTLLNDNPEGLRWFFENWRISENFNPNGHAPKTVYMSELIDSCANELVAAIRTIILDGDVPLVQRDLLSSKVLMEMLNLRENLGKLTYQQLGKALRDEGFMTAGRHVIGEDRHFLWTRIGVFPQGVKAEEEAIIRYRHGVDPEYKFL